MMVSLNFKMELQLLLPKWQMMLPILSSLCKEELDMQDQINKFVNGWYLSESAFFFLLDIFKHMENIEVF